MTRIILISTLMLGPASISLGESRQWTDQSGNTMRAEFTGVIDGRVVLKVGSKRQPFALTDFSLDDRDYIREQLVKRRQQQKLAELMQSVPSVRRVSSVPGAPDTDTPTEVYGLQVPSPPLLQPESPREWTDLLDREFRASCRASASATP